MLMNNVIDTIPYINKKYKINDVSKVPKFINCWWDAIRICPISKPTKKARMTYEISTIKDNEEVLFTIRKINGKYRRIPYYKKTTIKNLHALLTGSYPDGTIATKKDINSMSVLKSVFNHSMLNFNENNEIPRELLLQRLKSF
jgi:hypothetical protein